MPKEVKEDFGQIWNPKLKAADKYFEKWEGRFKCKILDDYYEGFQWAEVDNYTPYVINLIFSTIAVKNPTLLFTRPQFSVAPDASEYDSVADPAFQLASLQTDTLNTLVSRPNVEFAENIEMAILDSWTYFGLVEVGYDATYVKNPNAGKPLFSSDVDPNTLLDDATVEREPDEIPEEEKIYAKRIRADRFRIGGNDSWDLKSADWVGYFEYWRIEDIKAAENFKNTSKLDEVPSPGLSDNVIYNPDDDKTERGCLVKLWKIWDLRAKKFYIFNETNNLFHFEEDFKRLPLFPLRFNKRRKGWYPIPPVWVWKPSQDEQNEAKEQLRAARRRAKRAFQATSAGVDDNELTKLTTGPDMVVIRVDQPNAIQPINSQPLDSSTMQSMAVSKDDFNIVSGTSSEARGQADRTTATQAQITNQRAGIRESAEREIVANWLCQIGREILMQAQEKLTQPTWIKINSDIGAWGQDYNDIQEKLKLIDPVTSLGKHGDFRVQINVESMSPVTNDTEKRKLLEFLAVLNQFPMLSLQPILIREVAYRVGYRNEAVIRAMQQAAHMQMAAQMAQGEANMQRMGGGPAQNNGPQGGNIMQQRVAQMQPPDQEMIQNQLAQVGGPNG